MNCSGGVGSGGVGSGGVGSGGVGSGGVGSGGMGSGVPDFLSGGYFQSLIIHQFSYFK